jgi:hypothetical protein
MVVVRYVFMYMYKKLDYSVPFRNAWCGKATERAQSRGPQVVSTGSGSTPHDHQSVPAFWDRIIYVISPV